MPLFSVCIVAVFAGFYHCPGIVVQSVCIVAPWPCTWSRYHTASELQRHHNSHQHHFISSVSRCLMLGFSTMMQPPWQDHCIFTLAVKRSFFFQSCGHKDCRDSPVDTNLLQLSVLGHHHCCFDVYHTTSGRHQSTPCRSSWLSLPSTIPSQSSGILQMLPSSWSFLCQMVSIAVHCRCTWLLTSLFVTRSCHLTSNIRL